MRGVFRIRADFRFQAGQRGLVFPAGLRGLAERFMRHREEQRPRVDRARPGNRIGAYDIEHRERLPRVVPPEYGYPGGVCEPALRIQPARCVRQQLLCRRGVAAPLFVEKGKTRENGIGIGRDAQRALICAFRVRVPAQALQRFTKCDERRGRSRIQSDRLLQMRHGINEPALSPLDGGDRV